MNRRAFLAATGAACSAALAGCASLTGDADDASDPVEPLDSSELPDGAYVPRHTDPMEMLGMQMDDGVHVMLSYTSPHHFYTVTGDRTNQAEVGDADAVHLMVSAWDGDTGLVPSDVEPTVTAYRDGEDLGEVTPWSMLSQPMGFHFGDNVAYDEGGEYTFEVSFSATSATAPSDLAERFASRTVEFVSEFDPASTEDLETSWNEDSYGDAGALEPMSMEMGETTMQTPQLPPIEELPGDPPEAQHTDDVALTVATADPADLGADHDAERHLVVPTRTRYNRYPVPNASLAATVTRDGEAVADVDLSEGVHGDYGHYYGAGVPALQSGDEVEVRVETPSQVARHSGYERAFLDHEPVTFTL